MLKQLEIRSKQHFYASNDFSIDGYKVRSLMPSYQEFVLAENSGKLPFYNRVQNFFETICMDQAYPIFMSGHYK